ncbi:MAG: type II toxin-antitoxin system RelE/ParE family toxin [Betaproteobacteria bacterium]|nr:type II toxin-antitoxin system RelE/ParE family toxin [Betaproteobacteria bacterium]MBI3057412.1 type II toxin-antitoxin system RelE/ParE family toxin [Betaproteobacteria bacterium]
MPASVARPLSLSPRAIQDIAAIEAYYAQFGLVTADRVIATIKSAAESLRLNPLIGTEGIRKGTRHKVIGRYPYSIVYRVHRERIQVVRVLHQRREYFNPPSGNGSPI